jgi:hypothetical protein
MHTFPNITSTLTVDASDPKQREERAAFVQKENGQLVNNIANRSQYR